MRTNENPQTEIADVRSRQANVLVATLRANGITSAAGSSLTSEERAAITETDEITWCLALSYLQAVERRTNHMRNVENKKCGDCGLQVAS